MIDSNLCVWKKGAVREALLLNAASGVLKITIPMVEQSNIFRWPHAHS